MHKALDQMNLRIHHVIPDITGKSGGDIVNAILEGERNPKALAALGDKRLKASRAILIAALTGDYRNEHLFCLEQAKDGYEFTLKQIAQVDERLEAMLKALEQRQPCAPGEQPAQTIYSEIGGDLSAFKSGKHFASWLGLNPDNRASGKKVLSAHIRPCGNRVARALRMAAQGLHHANNEPEDYYRRMKAKLGGAAGLVAVAHKLARIIYAVLTTRKAYEPALHKKAEAQRLARSLEHLRKKQKHTV